jgi:hypothetical protein
VGGGAFSTTYGARWVTRHDKFKRSVYVRTKHSLASACDQAGVVAEVGDMVWVACGRLPFVYPVEMYRINVITETHMPDEQSTPLQVINRRSFWGYVGTPPPPFPVAICDFFGYIDAGVPAAIVAAIETYHNQDGTVFVDAQGIVSRNAHSKGERS